MNRNMEELRIYLDLEQHLRDVVQDVGEETAMLYLDLAIQRVLLKSNIKDNNVFTPAPNGATI